MGGLQSPRNIMEAKVLQTKPASTMTHLQGYKSVQSPAGQYLPDYDQGSVLVGEQDDPAQNEREDEGEQAVAQHTHRLEE